MFILLMILALFFIYGLFRYKTILNPISIFNGVWLVAVFLYSLELSRHIHGLSPRGMQALIIMALTFNSAFIYTRMISLVITKHSVKKKQKKMIRLSVAGIKLLFSIWLVLIVLSISYSKGFPVVWMLLGIPKSYAQFGIPTVQGFINSLAWVVLMMAFYFYLDSQDRNKKKTMKKIMVSIFGVYTMLIARQFMITAAVQLFLIYGLKRKVKIKHYIIWPSLGVLLFGIIGNFRSGSEHFRAISGINRQVPDFLLGLHWVYMYMATPIGNIDSLVNQSFEFSYGTVSLLRLLPTAFVSLFLREVQVTNVNFLVTEAFNISTFLRDPYRDFGMIGIVFISAIHGIFGTRLWHRCFKSKNDPQGIMLYAVMAQILLMTFFSGMILSLPIVIQFIYIKLFFKLNIFAKVENYEVYQ